MPISARTDIEIAQRAMVLVGLEPLTSFTDNSDEALVMNTLYEDMVEDCLAQHSWKFATGQKQLSRLTDAPLDRWDAAYSLPTEPSVMQVHTVYERYIYINAGENDDVVLNYMFRVDTQYWPPAFALWVIYRLASVLSLSVTRNAEVAESYVQLAQQQFRMAKARDSQQVTTQGLRLTRYHKVRRGAFLAIEGETV